MVKFNMCLVIVGIFAAIFLLFFFAWGGTFVIGAIGLAVCLFLYAIIASTPLSKFFIRITHHREPSEDKMFNSFLIAVSFYYGSVKIASYIAALFLLICRLFFAFVIFICFHRWDSAYITFYLSKLPLKIFMFFSSPIEAIIEWVANNLDFKT
jgi:hypothetical protein